MSNIVKLWISEGLSRFELIAGIFVLFLLSKDLTMLEVMILQSFFTVSITLLEVPSGVFADVFGRKTSLMLSRLFVMGGFIAYVLAPGFIAFLFAELLIAIAVSLFSGADSAIIYDSLKEKKKEKDFKKVMGIYKTIDVTSLGTAAIIGGMLATRVGYEPLFYISVMFMFASLLVLFTVREPKVYTKLKKLNYMQTLKKGFRHTFTHKKVRIYTVYASVFGAFSYMLYYLIQPYYRAGGWDDQMVSLGVAAFFFALTFGFLLAHRISNMFDTNKQLIIYLAIGAACMIGTAFVNVWFGLILITIMMFVSAIKDIVTDQIINEVTSSNIRATVISIKSMGANLVYTLIGPVVGVLTDAFDIRVGMLAVGITLLTYLIYVLIVWHFDFKIPRKRLNP